VCCSVLQCVAVCCSVLQCVAVCCSVVQFAAVCCTVLHCVAVCYSVLQFIAMFCSVLHCCSVLQCVAASHEHTLTLPLSLGDAFSDIIFDILGVLQCVAVWYNVLQYLTNTHTVSLCLGGHLPGHLV